MLSYNQKNYAQRIKSLLNRDTVLHTLVDPDEYREDLEERLRYTHTRIAHISYILYIYACNSMPMIDGNDNGCMSIASC